MRRVPSVPLDMSPVFVRLTVTDLPVAWPGDGAVGWSRSTRTVWCRLPAGWFVGERLAGARRRQLAAALSPTGSDSCFLVIDWREERLTAEQARTRPWRDEVAGALVGTDHGVLASTDLAALS